MKILMVGNSLTSANDMPCMLAKMLYAGVTCVTRGGARLAEFSNPKTKTGARVLTKLAETRFDFVVMQDMSHLAASNPEAHRRAVEKMCALARQNGAVRWCTEHGPIGKAIQGSRSSAWMVPRKWRAA